MSKTKRTGRTSNPRKVPRSQADVDKAYQRGQDDGTRGALTIMLYTLQDKFGADEEQLREFSKAFNYTLDSMMKGYIKEKDLVAVLKDEYGTTVEVIEDD